MLKKLHSFILKSFLGPFVLTFFISLFILLMQFLWKYIDDLVGKGLEWSVIGELLAYQSASLVHMALPLAILLASIMTFGNLGENNELLALKSSGISLQKIMAALIVFITFVSLGAFFFSNKVMPYTNLKTWSLLYDITHQRPELNIKEGIFNNDVEGYSIKIGKKSQASDMLYDIMIYDHTAYRGAPNVTVADSGTMKITADDKFMLLTLFNGKRYEEMKEEHGGTAKKHPHRYDTFVTQKVILEMDGFEFTRTPEHAFSNNYLMLNLAQLEHAEDSLTDEFAKSSNALSNQVLASNYFRNVQGIVDTTTNKTEKTFELTKNHVPSADSLIASLNDPEKLMYLRNTKRYIEEAKTSFDRKVVLFKSKRKTIHKHQIEWHRKFSLSFACLVFFFIGAPLGAIIRKGGLGMPVVVSVVFFILYYVISLSGEKFVREGLMPGWQGMWISSVVLLPLGIFLTYKATRDSVILNVETYFEGIKRIFKSNKQQ